MKLWKTLFFVTLLALIGSNAFWLFEFIDDAVTYTYQQESLKDQAKPVETLGSLIVKGSQEYSQEDILHLLRQSNPEAFIVEVEDLISYEGIDFVFENGTLLKVSAAR